MTDMLQSRANTKSVAGCWRFSEISTLCRATATVVLAPYGITGQGKPHPRFYGTFVRVLGHYVRDLGLMPLHTAVHKMTGGSAAALRLVDRGTLTEGNWADVTVFDPDTVAEVATYDEPHQYATGISTVVVNGEVVIDEAAHTGALARAGVAEGSQWRWLAPGAALPTGGPSERALLLIRPRAMVRVTQAPHWKKSRTSSIRFILVV